MMMFRLRLARGHDRGRNQGGNRQDESQAGDQALDGGNHERMLRGGVRGQQRVNSRGEGRALID